MASNPMKVMTAQLSRMQAWAEQGTGIQLRAASLVLVRAIKLELSKPGNGRRYGRHVASKPGQPPAVDTGRLRMSVGYEMLSPFTSHVGPGAPYAAALEFGTLKDGGYIAPRPFMRGALRKSQKQMQGVIVQGLRTDGPDKAAK